MIRIVTSKWLDVAALRREIGAGERPRHVLLDLAEKVSARIEVPDEGLRPNAGDHLRGRVFSTPGLWALARKAVADCAPDDTLFCTGEDIGIPLAACCGRRSKPPRLVVTVHNLNRPRGRFALRFFHAARYVSLWITPAPTQAEFLIRHAGVSPERVRVIPEQSDTAFYRPSQTSAAPRARPVIASVGLEQRDYRTLAEATRDLPVDVRISGFSTDAHALRAAFPDEMPANMSRKYYEWTQLAELYRSADLVVVPLFPNGYVAGITTFLEALACRRPLIVTRTDGLAAYSNTPGICETVAPGDPVALRRAIEELLRNRPLADQLAARGYAWLLAHHTPEHWINAVAVALL
jgi:glycosyltransferase involved in cell wall biosynthesis